jgi:CheY-like chemotaxis protein
MALFSLTVEVLLVEDDPGDELMTREAFSEIGSRLHVARDGEEALDFLYRRGRHRQAPRVDLVLLDLGLPKQDGREVLAQIRDDPQLTHLPVVVLTASNAESDIVTSYQLHANAYITKPADMTQYADTIRRIDEFFLSVVRLPRA